MLQEKVQTRLQGLVDMARGVADLEKFNQSGDEEVIHFLSWTPDRFGKITYAFKNEVLLYMLASLTN